MLVCFLKKQFSLLTAWTERGWLSNTFLGGCIMYCVIWIISHSQNRKIGVRSHGRSSGNRTLCLVFKASSKTFKLQKQLMFCWTFHMFGREQQHSCHQMVSVGGISTLTGSAVINPGEVSVPFVTSQCVDFQNSHPSWKEVEGRRPKMCGVLMKVTPGWECARYQTILMHTASLSGTDEMKQIKNALISGGKKIFF